MRRVIKTKLGGLLSYKNGAIVVGQFGYGHLLFLLALNTVLLMWIVEDNISSLPASCLFHRCQRIGADNQVSCWKTLCGSMPQGSRLGPLSFIVMIDKCKKLTSLKIIVRMM